MKIEICGATMIVGIVMVISVTSMFFKIVSEVQQASVRTACYKTQQATIAASQPQPNCDK